MVRAQCMYLCTLRTKIFFVLEKKLKVEIDAFFLMLFFFDAFFFAKKKGKRSQNAIKNGSIISNFFLQKKSTKHEKTQ
jgi:hypothetical protein